MRRATVLLEWLYDDFGPVCCSAARLSAGQGGAELAPPVRVPRTGVHLFTAGPNHARAARNHGMVSRKVR